MNIRIFLLSTVIVFATFFLTHAYSFSGTNLENPYSNEYVISIAQDTTPISERYDSYIYEQNANPFDLKDPPIIEKEIEYDPESGQYIVYERIGDEYYRMPYYLTFDEYMEYREEEQERDYFKKLAGMVDAGASASAGGLVDPIKKLNLDEDLLDRLFGGTDIEITPTGKIGLVFGYGYNKTDNPAQIQRNQSFGYPIFDMQPLEMNVQGKIGDKLNLDMSYNTAATFNFDNQMKINYSSDEFSEDEIIKKIEAGNVSMPLQSNLIQGSEALFGLKTELQFGRFWLTALASQKRSRQESIRFENGAQEQTFEVKTDEYDQFRHFFLSHFNRDTYEDALKNIPQVNSLFNITNIEVWVTNDNNNVNDASREIVAFADLGENTRITNQNQLFQGNTVGQVDKDICGQTVLPQNAANEIYDAFKSEDDSRSLDQVVSVLQSRGFQQGRDYEKIRGRKLRPSEFEYHRQLGFISVNINLRPDQVLAVAYEYDYNGKYYAVGDLANNVATSSTTLNTTINNTNTQNPNLPQFNQNDRQQQVMFMKLLKGTTPRIDLPLWDLMMKNVYSIGAYNVNREDFLLDIYYDDPGEAEKRFLPETNLAGKPLLEVFGLDRLNVQQDPVPDGRFDFIQGLTINTNNGRLIFPKLEPFGEALSKRIDDPALAEKYSYQYLYDSTLTRAREYPEFNRFTIKGRYKSSVSSEISLGAFNLPPNSVRVTAGRPLKEGIDYEVDYQIGRVRILNDALLAEGVPINVSFENNSLFGFQQKTMLGLRGEYRWNEDIRLGGTYMHLFERPFTQKVNIGDDPVNNRIYGLDFSFSKPAPWITKVVDALPLIETKAESNINFFVEGAFLKPGHARAVNESREDKDGILMVDDFEGSANSIDLRNPANQWFLASVPQNDLDNNNPLFPESSLINDYRSGVNRAKLSWYRMEPQFQILNNDADETQSYYTSIPQTEVFPNLQIQPLSQNNTVFSFDLTYYPDERGAYNFDSPEGTVYSEGMNDDGTLKDPESRWAGVMREITANNDFEQSNVEFIEFWVLSPFLPKPDGSPIADRGDLYLNIGNISEDILRDSRQAYENGLPGVSEDEINNRPTRYTNLGRVPELTPLINGFNQDLQDRAAQDVGLDGMDNNVESIFFQEQLAAYNTLNTNANLTVNADPSADDFIHFNDERYSNETNPVERYRDFNGTEGNSPQQTGNLRSAGTNYPDSEDLNNDKSLNETESYFQYRIPFIHDGTGGVLPNEFMTDVREPNGANGRKWYRFKVPLNQFTSAVGGIQDFRSIRFMRMYLTGFDEQVTFRFARLELVRNQWRRYQRSLAQNSISSPEEGSATLFDVNAINIEENGGRCPFNYVLPPGIVREQSLGAFPNVLQNEQSLSMDICNLADGDARAIYKLQRRELEDMRVYKRLKMFVHAENAEGEDLETGKLTAFIRLGTDFEQNYYEYEIPLDFSDLDEAGANCSNGNNSNDQAYIAEVWKDNNSFDFPLEVLRSAKLMRNNVQDRKAGLVFTVVDSTAANFNPNWTEDQQELLANKIRVKGNPTIGEVKGIMIGVRNKRDDGIPTCAEIWVNELRVSGFDERGGAAALAQIDMNLADFGQAGASAQYTSIGWGGLEDRVQERARESVAQYQAQVALELGKLFPEQSGVKIPFLFNKSNVTKTPEYDPYDTDIVHKDNVAAQLTEAAKDSVRNQAKDITNITSYNFTNVRKDRTKQGEAKPWDISNFTFNYSRSRTEHSDPLIKNETIDSYVGGVDYDYSMKPLYIRPFKKVIKGNNLDILKDMNLNLIPNKFFFNTILDRNLTTTEYRFVELDQTVQTPDYAKQFFTKQFTWARNYNLDWDITKSLRLTFDALNEAVIDELPKYVFDANRDLIATNSDDDLRQEIIDNLQNFGRPKYYNHNVNASFNVPFKKIPFLDWLTVKANYAAGFDWAAASLVADSLGNVISNNRDIKLDGDINFETIYKKSDYLSAIGGKKRSSRGSRKSSGLNRATDSSKNDDKKDKKRKKVRTPSKAEMVLIRPLLMIRKGKLSYQQTEGTSIPGFMGVPRFFGLTDGFVSPGWQFVSGWQPGIRSQRDNLVDRGNFLYQLEDDGWMTNSAFLADKVTQSAEQRINTSLTLEPVNDFRIELQAARSYREDYLETFKITEKVGEDYERLRPLLNNGSLTISYNGLNTLFKDSLALINAFDEAKLESAWLQATEDYGIENNLTADQLAAIDIRDVVATVDSTGYPEGYGELHQGSYVPAFLAAYGGNNLQTVRKMLDNDVSIENIGNMFSNGTFPRINWNVNYSGLTKIPAFKEIFKSFDIAHSYKSDLTINQYQTHQKFNPEDRYQVNIDNENNYFPSLDIPDIGISDNFSPLIGFGFELQNSFTLDIDYNKSRLLSLRTADQTLTVNRSDEITVGVGFTMEDVYIGFLKNLGNSGGKKKKKDDKGVKLPGGIKNTKDRNPEKEFTSDLTFTLDFSYSNNITYINRLKDRVDEITRGSRDFRVSTTLDYGINEQLNVQLYFDYTNLFPLVTTSFPQTTAQGGLKILFTL